MAAPMLPTPDTSHVPYSRVYEPAEDSFLLLDTLSSPTETAFLHARFGGSSGAAAPQPAPLVVEIGPGSGVVLAFLAAHARTLFGTAAVLAAGVDVNRHACGATRETAARACAEHADTAGAFLAAVQGDLAGPLRRGAVDVLVFNPPYVPTDELPRPPPAPAAGGDGGSGSGGEAQRQFDEDSYLLALSYAGGRDGMETTDRLIDELPDVLAPRGCAYLLLCAQNRPEEVKARIRGFPGGWSAETVGTSGKKAGWERLQIIRIWRDHPSPSVDSA